MINACHISHTADDRSYFAEIKKNIRRYGIKIGLPANRMGEVDLIVAELTSNLYKHSNGGGEILAGCFADTQGEFIQIISLDNGPGFSNIEKVMADGYSTTGTLGAGLGSIKRLSDYFEICTNRGWGTVLLCRVYKKFVSKAVSETATCDALVIAKPGETCSGDGYSFQETATGFKVLHADGLGHGPEAKLAVDAAIEAFTICTETTPAATINYLHERLTKTRGMVANVIFYNKAENCWKIGGIGNINTRWAGRKGERSFTPANGIIGHLLPSVIREAIVSGDEYQGFISCSDGIKSRWDGDMGKNAKLHGALVQATAIYKDFSRRTDDVSVIVCKI